MTVLFAVLLSIFPAKACNEVTDQVGMILTDREGKIVHNPSKNLPTSGAHDKKQVISEDRVVPEGNEELLARLRFTYNSSRIKNESQDLLIHTVQELNKDQYQRILIQGFSDRSGRKSYNKKLSMKRAKAVQKWLTDWGINKEKIVLQALGEGKINDRRVEVRVVR